MKPTLLLLLKAIGTILCISSLHSTIMVAQADANYIIKEDFAKFKKGSEEQPDPSNIADPDSENIPENYTQEEGWRGGGVYQAGGSCFINSYEVWGVPTDGVIKTPKKDLEGTIVIRFRARSNEAGKSDLNVWLSNGITNEKISSLALTKEWTQYSFVYSIADGITMERAYIAFRGVTGALLSFYIDDIEVRKFEESGKELTFDIQQMHPYLNAPTEEFQNDFKEYQVEGDHNTYSTTFQDKAYTLITNADERGLLESIKLTASSTTLDEYLAILNLGKGNHRLGTFFGAKFSGKTSGVKQTIDETIALLQSNANELRVVAIFNPHTGVYFVLDWDKGTYSLTLCRNYLPLYIDSFITALHSSFELYMAKHYYLCNRINLFGLLKLNFPAIKNSQGDLFTMDCIASSDKQSIQEININLNTKDNSDNTKAIAIWKSEAQRFVKVFTSFIELYATDASGKKIERFSNLEEAIAFVESDNREHGVTLVTQQNEKQIALVINKKSLFYLLNRAKEKPAISLHYTLPLETPLSFEITFKEPLRVDWGDGQLQTIEKGSLISGKLKGQHIYIFGNPTSFNAEGTQLEAIDVSGACHLTTLECANNNLKEIYLGDNVELQTLDLEKNKLKSINLSGLTQLKKLLLGNNELSSLNLSGLSQLTRLQVDNNKDLATLNLSPAPMLLMLSVSNCNLNELNLSDNTSIVKIVAQDNAISTIALEAHPNLESLNLQGNNLSSITIPNSPNLQSLNLSNNKLQNIEIAKGEKLQEVLLSHNALTSINNDIWKNAMRLNIGANKINKISVSNNKQLRDLYVYANQLTTNEMLSLAESIYSRKGANEPGHLYYVQKGNTGGNRIALQAVALLREKNWDIYEVEQTEDGWIEKNLSDEDLKNHPNELQSISSPSITCCYHYGRLSFSAPVTSFSVYTLSGEIITTVTQEGKDFSITLPRGYFLVVAQTTNQIFQQIIVL